MRGRERHEHGTPRMRLSPATAGAAGQQPQRLPTHPPACTPHCAGTAAAAPPGRPPPGTSRGGAGHRRLAAGRQAGKRARQPPLPRNARCPAHDPLLPPSAPSLPRVPRASHLAWLHRRCLGGGVVPLAHADLACDASQPAVVGIAACGRVGRGRGGGWVSWVCKQGQGRDDSRGISGKHLSLLRRAQPRRAGGPGWPPTKQLRCRTRWRPCLGGAH